LSSRRLAAPDARNSTDSMTVTLYAAVSWSVPTAAHPDALLPHKRAR
jgi:hypothetical protein